MFNFHNENAEIFEKIFEKIQKTMFLRKLRIYNKSALLKENINYKT